MLTARSTPEDIARFIEKNAERMAGIEEELGRQLRKLCIRNRMKTAARSVVKTVDGTRVAFLCRYELRGFGFVCYHQMYVSETNEWLSRVYARSDCAFSITAHCVRRYAERCLGDRDMPAEKVLMQLTKRNACFYTVYYDDAGHQVRACRDGLFLCLMDERRSILVQKTFVSMDMLKRTQRAAYDAVQRLFLREGFGVSETVESALNSRFDALVIPTCERAIDIYAEFFKDKKQ